MLFPAFPANLPWLLALDVLSRVNKTAHTMVISTIALHLESHAVPAQANQNAEPLKYSSLHILRHVHYITKNGTTPYILIHALYKIINHMDIYSYSHFNHCHTCERSSSSFINLAFSYGWIGEWDMKI